MSFRELRNFTEIMRALGYPRLVSVDNFRKPHFALVADILYWMATRYDPNAHIPDDIDTENERVLFVTKVAELFAAKAGIKSIIQPGGSIKDSDAIDVADELGLSMLFTKARHFYH